MKRHGYALLLAAYIAASGCAGGAAGNAPPPVSYEKRILVAVGDLQNRTGNGEYDALTDGLTGSLIYELHETRAFRLIERERLKAILDELKLGMLGLIDPRNAKEVGRMLGIQAVLFVNLASVRHSSDVSSAVVAQAETETIEVTMDARLVAVETGEILAAAKSASLHRKLTGSAAMGLIKSGDKVDRLSVVQNALEASVRELAQKIAREAYERGR